MKARVLKWILSSWLLIAGLSSLFSAEALQRVYALRDDEYESVMLLCQAAGVRYPTVTPVTANELISALERIPDDSSPLVLEKRDGLIRHLRGDDVIYRNDSLNFDIGVYGGADGLLHGSNIDRYEFFVPYRDLDPMIAGSLNASFGNAADLYFEFMEKDSMMPPAEPMDRWVNFHTITSFGKDLSQSYQPFRVGISTGNDWFNFQLARNRQSFGQGITGNLFISDNFSYEEYVRASFSSEIFNYYLDITHFDQQIGPLTFKDFQLSGKHQVRAVHRFEFTPTRNLVFSVMIGSLFQSDSMFDWRMFIPLMVPHSFNNFTEDEAISEGDEANNMFGIDISWSFLPSWVLHFEAVMDQFQLSYEQGNFMPNAFGFLLNVQNTSVIADGFLHSYAEVVYTMPYLYLNRAKMDGDVRDYNYDWILGHKLTGGSEIAFSGYPEGPDTFRISIGSGYMFSYGLNVGGSLDFMIHGKHGIAYDGGSDDTVNEDWRTEGNVFEYTFAPGLSVSYDFDFGLSVGLDAYFPFRWNYRNIEGDSAFIPQGFLFVRYSFL